MNRLVGDFIKQKNLEKFSWITPDTSIFEAIKTLGLEKTGVLIVLENNFIKGIFCEKNFTRNAVISHTPLYAKVDTVMTKKVYFAPPEFTLEDCLQVMKKVHVRYLPIVDKKRPIGLVSMRHIMEALIEDKKIRIEELTNYIMGGGFHNIYDFHKKEDVAIYHTA